MLQLLGSWAATGLVSPVSTVQQSLLCSPLVAASGIARTRLQISEAVGGRCPSPSSICLKSPFRCWQAIPASQTLLQESQDVGSWASHTCSAGSDKKKPQWPAPSARSTALHSLHSPACLCGSLLGSLPSFLDWLLFEYCRPRAPTTTLSSPCFSLGQHRAYRTHSSPPWVRRRPEEGRSPCWESRWASGARGLPASGWRAEEVDAWRGRPSSPS
jgi:hypothetical protein